MERTHMHRRAIGFGAIACCLLVVSGCGSKKADETPSKSSAPAVADERRARETSGGSYFVSYEPVPSPIPLNQVFQLKVRVFKDAAMTTPADGVAVTADAAMPHHHHGMNLVPRSEQTGPGQFRISGMLFHMPGYWEIYVDVKEGARDERARFEVTIK